MANQRWHMAMQAAPNSIFICYRRLDSADVVGRIYEHLVRDFGKEAVFRDVDAIPLGVDFRDHIRGSLGTARVGLVVIGPDWWELQDDGITFRLEEPQDHVRIEVETLLASGVITIPCFVRGVTTAKYKPLPSSLGQLPFLNGLALRPDPDFYHDIDVLKRRMATLLSQLPPNAVAKSPPMGPKRERTESRAAVPAAPPAQVGEPRVEAEEQEAASRASRRRASYVFIGLLLITVTILWMAHFSIVDRMPLSSAVTPPPAPNQPLAMKSAESTRENSAAREKADQEIKKTQDEVATKKTPSTMPVTSNPVPPALPGASSPAPALAAGARNSEARKSSAVTPGDRSTKMATGADVTVSGIVTANDLKNEKPVVPEAVGKTPPPPEVSAPKVADKAPTKTMPGLYTVRKGDTLTSIGKSFGISFDDMVKANKIAYPKKKLEEGQVLKIPPLGQVSPTPTPKPRTVAEHSKAPPPRRVTATPKPMARVVPVERSAPPIPQRTPTPPPRPFVPPPHVHAF